MRVALKTMALMRKTRFHGVAKVDWIFTFALVACKLVRMRNLVGTPAEATVLRG